LASRRQPSEQLKKRSFSEGAKLPRGKRVLPQNLTYLRKRNIFWEEKNSAEPIRKGNYWSRLGLLSSYV